MTVPLSHDPYAKPMDAVSQHLASPAATRQFAADIALAIRPGETLWLVGELGAGKSEFARAFIRALCGDPDLEVPSPTFSLIQTYAFQRAGRQIEIIHADLYRISDPGEVSELGLSEAPATDRILLIEWPQMGGGSLAEGDFLVSFAETGEEDGRLATVSGTEENLDRIRRSLVIREFLDTGWREGVQRQFLLGDASARSYETASVGTTTRIVMNAPRQPDGPVLEGHGKPYSRIAHLAEDVGAFVGMQKILSGYGLSVPRIHAADLDAGLLLLQDLGRRTVLDATGKPDPERYMTSVDALVHLHGQPVRRQVEIAPARCHEIPAYDRAAMTIEASLLADWYAPRKLGRALSPGEREDFDGIWSGLIARLDGAETHVVLRDFHSPNILWLEDRTNYSRAGLIDFQDAVIGPVAYDVASLAQDARVDVAEELEAKLVGHYMNARRSSPDFDAESFRVQYAIMAAQRATKILGIFVRLDQRDGKPAYLAHLPRIETYIRRSTRHPELAGYLGWLESVTGL
jgi:tRNA threonylcarbamoyl adenosine modification protein YjeE